MKRELVRLAVKDFQVQARSAKNYAITLIVFLAVFLLMSPMQYHMALSMAALITLYRFINSTMYEDEKNNTLRLIDSLPVGRENVVKARYLSTGILAVALLIILGVVTAIIDMAYGSDTAGLAICMFLFYVILMSVYMPIGFRLGYIKAVNINRFIFLGIFILFGFLSALMGNLARQQQGPGPAEGAMILPADMSPVLVMALFAVVTFLLYIVSMKVSVVFYKKRELF